MFRRLSSGKRRGLVSDPTGVAGTVPGSSGRPVFNESLERYPEYDIVILGGGTAGCVLAGRLSEDPRCRVLLLEAGESGVAQLYSRIPVASSRLFGSESDWSVRTEPQDNAEERSLFWPRAKLLGGCSSINGLMFHNGSPADFDEWAILSGCDEWRWEQFQQYFMKFENFTTCKGYFAKDTARGRGGPVQTGFVGFYSNFAKMFVRSCISAGMKHRHDFNTSEGTIGAGRLMTFIDSGGKRSSTESAYLTSEVLARPNLTVLTGAHITRILLDRDLTDGKKRAAGVEFVHGPFKTRYRVRASREVVVSCGAVHTPHILMLSGIGPAEHLRDVGLPCLQNLPVGQNLMDHASVNLRFRCQQTVSLNKVASSKGWKQIYALPSLAEWAIFGTGKLLCTIADGVAFLRSTDRRLFPADQYPEQIEDTTSGPNSPDIEIFASPIAWWNHGLKTDAPKPESSEDLCSISTILLRPTSTGEVTLRSADPFEQPSVNPNYLATQHDIDVLRRSVRLLLQLGLMEPLASCIVRTETCQSLDQDLHKLGDTALDAVIRKRLETLYHPCGTAKMGSVHSGGVVDGHLRVHGIDGLRVVDASVFPNITSGHTAAPVIALAEKAADLMRKF